eukprot:gene13900-29574_t
MLKELISNQTNTKDSNTEKIHLKLPDGRIVQLKQYMYGLRHEGRKWQINLTKTLTDAGFTHSTADPHIFSKWKGNSFIQMAVHVDDLYITSSTPFGLDHVYDVLIRACNDVIRKEGYLLTYLGLAISHDRRTGSVTISQPAYMEKMLILGGFNDSNSIPTPMAIDQSSYDGYYKLERLFTFGCLSRIAQACSDPSEADKGRVRRILRHNNCAKDKGLIFKRVGGILSRFSLSKLRIKTLSSTVSEYVGICFSTLDIVFLHTLMNKMGFIQSSSTLVYVVIEQRILVGKIRLTKTVNSGG